MRGKDRRGTRGGGKRGGINSREKRERFFLTNFIKNHDFSI